MFEGSFTKETASYFTKSLNDLLRLDIDKLVIDFTKDKVKIGAQDAGGDRMSVIDYNSNKLFEGFTFPDNNFSFGIYDLSEVLSVMKIFDNGFDIKVTKEMINIQKDDNRYIYYGALEKKCNRGPRVLNPPKNPEATFPWADETSTFSKAMASLNLEHVVFTCKKDSDKINIAIANQQYKRYNNFNLKLDCKCSSDTRIVVDKNLFQPVLLGSISEFDVELYDKLAVLLKGSCDYYDVVFAVSPKKI